MTGPLTVIAPTDPDHVARKLDVDAVTTAKVNRAGDTMTGPLTLTAPTDPDHGARKSDVDLKLNLTGGALTGPLTLIEPTVNDHAARKLDVDRSYVPVGGIIMYSGDVLTLPSGWSLCDGGGGTPDLRGRFIVGSEGAYASGATGGAESVTLTDGQMPSHAHTGPSHNHTGPNHNHSGPSHSHNSGTYASSQDGSHNHNMVKSRYTSTSEHNHALSASGGSIAAGITTAGVDSVTTDNGMLAAGEHTHSMGGNSGSSGTANTGNGGTGNTGNGGTGATSTTGSGDEHENRQPYAALQFIIRA
jgi:microcystin-dependent protein